MIYNSLYSMIAFVIWPPFCTVIFYKGGQVTKPIIVVKMLCKLLYIIQIKNFLLDIKALGHL